MENLNTHFVTAEQLKAQCLLERYATLLAKPDVYPSKNNWDYIIEHKMEGGVGPGLYRKYLVAYVLGEDKLSDFHQLALSEFPRYLKAISHPYAVSVVYSDVNSSSDAVVDLALQCNLFDAPEITKLVNTGNIDLAIDLLPAFQPEYTTADLIDMQRLLYTLRHLPHTGRIENSRGMFRSETQFICENGHTNPGDTEFCRRENCGLNICGITREQIDAINDFESRISSLTKLLNKTSNTYL